MSGDRVRWGIIGCGAIARAAIAPAIRWSENGELLAIASRSGARAEALARELGAARAHGSYEALLEDRDVEAVYIGLPNGAHARWALLAAEAGKHVLCDKSLTLRLEDALALREAFGLRGLRLVEGFMVRHHPQWDLVRRALQGGAIGAVRHIQAWLAGTVADAGDHRFSAELGGGALFDVTCYAVNAARLVAGVEPLRVQAAARWARPGADEASDALLEMPGGVIAAVHGSLRAPADQGVIVSGERGRIVLTRPFGPGWDPVEVRIGDETHRVGGANHFLHQVEHFAGLVRDPAAEADPAEDGAANVAACVAIARAATDGRAADVVPVPARPHQHIELDAPVPMRLTVPADRPRAPVVLFLHGLGGSRDTHLREARSLAAVGLAAALPDAPHHGRRRGPLLDAMARAGPGEAAHELFLQLVTEAAREVPAIVDALLARGHPRVAIGGVSLGAFTALAAAAAEPRLAAVVSILGSPPGDVAERLAPRPVALFSAGRDEVVPPAASRRLAERLRPRYAGAPENLLYREYPGSEHMMRPEDWLDAWVQTVTFLRRSLAPR